MYGERDDPYAVLSRLGQRLEASLAPHAVLPAVVVTVREALRLPHVAIEVAKNGASETVASSGDPPGTNLRLPLLYGGERVGWLTQRSCFEPPTPG